MSLFYALTGRTEAAHREYLRSLPAEGPRSDWRLYDSEGRMIVALPDTTLSDAMLWLRRAPARLPGRYGAVDADGTLWAFQCG